jgi:hypothetical protein
VCRESICHIIDDGTRRFLDELLRYPNVPRDWKSAHASSATPTMPVIPPGFVSEGRILRYLSMVTTVGTPQTIAAQGAARRVHVPRRPSIRSVPPATPRNAFK